MSTTAVQPTQYIQQHYNKQRGQYHQYQQPAGFHQQSKSIPPLRVIQPAQLNNLSNKTVHSREQQQQHDSGSLGQKRTPKEVVSDHIGGLPAVGGGPNNAAMSMQRFCLRWNNHQTNLLSVFDQLLHDESFVDVTLAVEGQLLRAHKMVLSACSPYFQALFTSHPDKHPIVILKDVPYADMRSLLDFMYRGEVSVDQDRLTAFLRVAECLRIKGLTEVNEDTKPNATNTNSDSHHHHNAAAAPPQPSNLNYAQIQQHRLQHHQQQQLQAHIQQQHHQLQAAAAAAAAAAQQGKRFSVNHMLGGGSVLMQQQQHQHQPKRKRGRPRKLSGSSTGGMDEFETGEESGNGAGQPPKRTGNNLVQGSPELLEVKMSVDNFPTASNASEGSVSDRERDNDRDDEDELVIATHSSPEHGGSNQQQQGNQNSRKEDTGGSREDGESSRVKDGGGGDTGITTEVEEYVEDYEEELDTHNIPQLPETITLEVLPKPQETVIISTEQARVILRETQQRQQLLEQAEIKQESPATPQPEDSIMPISQPSTDQGVHFLTSDELDTSDCTITPTTDLCTYERKKSELLEYVTRHDGSVICKRCGELLASRTHWYRHKYKIHVTGGSGVINPAPLFKCTRCNVYFKSRKGFIGHTSARHSDDMEQQEELNISIKEEVVVSSEELPKVPRKREVRTADWEEQRSKEEQLVAAIIDRVKKECEAQGQTISRRGYSRRSTVMMMNSS